MQHCCSFHTARWTWSTGESPSFVWGFTQVTESQNHRIVGVGRDLCGSSSPTLPTQTMPEVAVLAWWKQYHFSDWPEVAVQGVGCVVFTPLACRICNLDVLCWVMFTRWELSVIFWSDNFSPNCTVSTCHADMVWFATFWSGPFQLVSAMNVSIEAT